MTVTKDSSSLNEQLQSALGRIAKLEQELNDRDRQLEVVITDHDQDIVDLRRSFEVDMFKNPPLAPPRATPFGDKPVSESVRWSIDSVRLGAEENRAPDDCQNCMDMRKKLKQYQRQWREISKNFRQVPTLLEGMITRTDNLVNTITKSPSSK